MRAEFQEIYKAVSQGRAARWVFDADGDQYIRSFRPKERLLVMGCGHVAQPVCKYGADLGFSVTVADDRPSFANSVRFPEAEEVICNSFAESLAQVQVTENDYVVVVTRGHRHDADCLRTILAGTFPKYLGMIGSKRRVIALFNLLESEGFPRKKLDMIHSPIGLDIGAETVKEIGISIVAELIQCRRQNRRPHGSVLTRDDIDLNLLDYLANDDTPKALLTVYDTSGSTPVSTGAMMAVDKNYRTVGTIGGGCSESAVMLDAFHLIGTGGKRCVTIDMSNDVAEEEGMVCGGQMYVVIEDFT